MDSSIEEMYIEIKGRTTELENTVKGLYAKLNQATPPIVKFNTAIAKRNLLELEVMRKKLEAAVEKKIQLNADVGSILKAKNALDSVNAAIQKVKASSTGLSNSGSSGGFGGLGALFGLGGGFAAVQGLQLLSRGMVSAIDSAREAQIVYARVEQAVKTTGTAAGFSAAQLASMASNLQALTGVGDDKILNDITLQLLTFTNISRESFARAQQAALDLSSVLGSDLLSQTIQLGKALENPVEGVSALQRVGITFTEVQKEQIKQFIKANDVMSAQSLILTEIETKYGGQAKATADAAGGIKQLKEEIGDLGEKIGAVAIPLIDWFTERTRQLIKNLELAGIFKDTRTEAEKLDASIAEMISQGASKLEVDPLREKLITELNKGLNQLRLNPNFRFEVSSAGVGDAIQAGKDQIKQLRDEINKETAKTTSLINVRTSMGLDSTKEQEDLKVFVTAREGRIKKIEEEVDSYKKYLPVFTQIKKVQDELAGKVIKPNVPGLTEEQLNAQQGATKAYYDAVRFEDASYYKWRQEQIGKDIEALKNAGAVGLNEKLYRINAQKILDKDYWTWRLANDPQLNGKFTGPILDKEKYYNYGDQIGPKRTQEFDQMDQDLEEYIQLEQDAQITRKDAWYAANSAILAGLDELTSGLRLKVSEGANAAEKALKSMANAGIAALTSLTNKLIAFAALKSLFPTASAGLTFFDFLKGHTGGTFYNGKKVASFSRGTDGFIVPPGFNNDSYPILVESGERVQVTPANSVSDQSRLLSSLGKKLDALNMNFINKEFSVHIAPTLQPMELERGELAKARNRAIKAGVKLDDIR